MLTGRLTMSKQGLTAHLPASTAVVAAVEPAGGQASADRTLQESVKLPPSLIACFDLVFMLQDKQPEHADKALGIETGDSCVAGLMAILILPTYPLRDSCELCICKQET